KRTQQGCAISQPVGRQVLAELQVVEGDLVILVDAEGLVGRAEVSRVLEPRIVLEGHVRRHGATGTAQAADDRTEGWPLRSLAPAVARLVRKTAVKLVGGVETDGLNATQDRQLVGNRSLLWHQFTKVHTGDLGLERLEFAANLGGQVRLHVIGVE